MSPAERDLWRRIQRRSSSLTPEMAEAILRAHRRIRDSFSEAELTRIIATGNIERLIQVALSEAILTQAFAPVRERIRSIVADNVKYFARDLPRGGRINGQIAVSFDILNPRVIDAVRQLDTRVIGTLTGDVRETVRAFAENGLRDGVNPRVVARQIRDVVGLAPHQERSVANFRRMLESGDPEVLKRALRDKRFDRTIEKAFAKGGKGLTIDQVDRMSTANRRMTIAFNAETNARTAALDSMKLGQRLSWEDAITKGAVERDRLRKTWVGVMDDRERESHRAMEGQTVSFDSPFSNGEMTPGESTYNCRCIARIFQRQRIAQ